MKQLILTLEFYDLRLCYAIVDKSFMGNGRGCREGKDLLTFKLPDPFNS